MKTWAKTGAAVAVAALLTACATTTMPYDYTAFKASKPKSILVLPPLNESLDVKATAGMLASSTQPLAESDFYVFPVAAVAETFLQNGLSQPADIHQVGLDKLREIFGADAVLYITAKEYGTSYKVITSETTVHADARLVDTRTGTTIWSGEASASSAERNNDNHGLIGRLLSAVLNQVISTASDHSFNWAQIAGTRLLPAKQPHGVMYGPYSPHYESQPGKSAP